MDVHFPGTVANMPPNEWSLCCPYGTNVLCIEDLLDCVLRIEDGNKFYFTYRRR